MSKPTLLQSLTELASKLGVSTHDGVPGAAYSDLGREELIIRYVDGTGVFGISDGRPFIKIQCKMYKLNGEEDGHHEGIDQPVIPDILEVFNRPPAPEPPFDEPKDPMVHFTIASHAKGMWTFGDGSTISAVGPANLHAIGYIDTASQLWVSADQLITGGTGRYEGVQGVKTVGGSSWVAKGKPFTARDPFMVRVLEVFRIVRKEFIASDGPR
jgi:hypothetical protein